MSDRGCADGVPVALSAHPPSTATAQPPLATDASRQLALLEVSQLEVAFETASGPRTAVDGVSLSLCRGESLGLVGESGSGKSALVRAVMGLHRTATTHIRGSVRFDGAELVGRKRRDLRRSLWGKHIAIVSQDPMTALNPVVPVGRQVSEVIRGARRSERRLGALTLLESVGIHDAERRLGQYPHELSGGMRQRVAIAMALAGNPELLLADEPTTALDVTVQAQILSLIGREQSNRGMGLVLVSHDLGVVATRTDWIAVMYAGQIVEMAATPALYRDPQMPYTRLLLASIPRADRPRPGRLFTIGGRPPAIGNWGIGCRFAPRCPHAEDVCRHEAPPLASSTADPSHLVRCWLASSFSRSSLQLDELASSTPSQRDQPAGHIYDRGPVE